jgi:hypothetical protein
MLNDFRMFENYMASQTFKDLPEEEQNEFLSSYHKLLEEEMDITLQEAKHYLDQKTISDLFYRIYGHLDKQVLKEKDDQWNATFGFRPSSMNCNNTSS